MRAKWRVIGGGLLLVVLVFGGVSVWAATINVPGDYTTIQVAINAASPGDTINVAAGMYSEALYIDKAVSLVGAGRDVTTIEVPATMPSYTANEEISPLIMIDTTTADISGFKLDGKRQGKSVTKLYYGVVFWKSDGSISNCYITGFRDYPLGGVQDGIAIMVNHVWDILEPHNVTISDNIINDFQKCGIKITELGSNATISGNTITGQGPIDVIAAAGNIEIGYGATATIINNTIQDSWYTPNGPDDADANGILIIGADNVEVTGNTFQANDVGIYLCTDDIWSYGTSDNTLIQWNTITNGEVGVYSDDGGATGTVAHHNSIYSNTQYGVFNDGTPLIDATLNWWGDASGPSGGVADPVTGTLADGSGDKVSEHVLFDPWTGMSTGSVVVDPGLAPGETLVNVAAGVTVENTGTGTSGVIIAEYTAPPAGTPSFGAGATYVDVQLSDPGNVNELTITFEGMAAGTVIYFYLPGTGWIACSHQVQVGGTITVTITDSTVPTLAQLTGTIFAEGSALGNVNGDDVIDVLDVRLCLQIATGFIEGTGAQRAAADVDGDGDVDLDDAQYLAEYIIGIITALPGGG